MRYIRLIALMGLFVGLIVVAVDCASLPKALETEPDFTGFITEINLIGEKHTLSQILVESYADKLVDKYMVTINDETMIFEEDGNELHPVAFKELETKQRVQLWFSGPVMESFPMQVTAQQVVILGNASVETTHRQIAEYWAPIWWQDTDDDNFRADYITNIDFDGDWNPLNNWDNLSKFDLNAYIAS